MPIFIRPASRSDQLEIAEYYDAEGGQALGDRFINQCLLGFARLKEFPESGSRLRFNHPSLKNCRFILVPDFKKILIFYLNLPGRIEIIRLLHGSRDIEEALEQALSK